MIVFPNCKINLGLHILQKRADGFHDLETVFYPVPLQDGLEIIQNPSSFATEIEFTSSGLEIDVQPETNICYRAFLSLKKDFPHLPSIKIHLHKTIPAGAGLGGGSADGAFTLLLLNKKFNLGLSPEQLVDYALRLGSDCPFFILNQPCFATGRGEFLERLEIDLSMYRFVLINPNIHIATGWAFSQINPTRERVSLKEVIARPITEWKESLKNDFEQAVFIQYPQIRKVKEHLYEAGAVYASLSGSGSTVYALFPKNIHPQFEFPASYFRKLI